MGLVSIVPKSIDFFDSLQKKRDLESVLSNRHTNVLLHNSVECVFFSQHLNSCTQVKNQNKICLFYMQARIDFVLYIHMELSIRNKKKHS